MPTRHVFGSLIVTMVCSSCAGAPFPRETHANNARSHDPWLDGETCTENTDTTGLRFEEIAVGVGDPFEQGFTIRAHYVASIAGGATIHNSQGSGPPVEVMLGSSKTICGFEKGLLGMRAGGQRRVFVSWRLAFGESGRAPDVGPRTDLVFVIDAFAPADVVLERGSRPVNPTSGGRGGRGR